MNGIGPPRREAVSSARYPLDPAQSYRDNAERELALAQYLSQPDLADGSETAFLALYCAARLKEELDHPPQDVIDAYLQASDAFPARAEALFRACRFCGGQGRKEEAFRFAQRGGSVPRPTAGLFIEQWIYDWGLLDELAIHGYWSGHYRASLDACLKLLASPLAPSEQRQRFAANARAALEKLPRESNLGSLGSESLVDQHPLAPPRPLRSQLTEAPRVLVAILAKQKEAALPLYLECIEALEYPKSSIFLHVRTNNNTDRTEHILREWVARIGHLYAGIEFDAENVAAPLETFKVHEWNATRLSVLGRIRNISLQRARERECDFYFVADVDNFIRPCTLRELVALNLPIVAPLLRSIGPGQFYSNYHAEIDVNGYYRDCDQYLWMMNRWVRGVFEVPVVHCTYLVRGDVLPELTYDDGTARFEYVVFSHSARNAGISQYLDNRQVYGYLTFADDDAMHVNGGTARARAFLKPELELSAAAQPARQPVSGRRS